MKPQNGIRILKAGTSAIVLLCSLWSTLAADVAAVSKIGISHGSAGGGSYAPQFTGDGTSLLFLSHARNLTTNDDGNGFLKVYSLNLSNSSIRLLDVRNGASAANASLGNLSASSNGQHMVFESLATNLTANDTNRSRDVFLRSLSTGSTLLLSGNSNGTGNGDSYNAVISADGNWAAFESVAKDLADVGQGNGWNIYLYNRLSGIITAASHGQSPTTGNAYSPVLTPDGAKMAFVSTALGLADDSSAGNGLGDVYIRHNQSGSIYWAGRGLSTNVPGPYACQLPQISDSGHQVIFKAYSQSNQQTYVCFFDNSSNVNFVISTNADPASIPVLSGDARLVASESNSNIFLWNLETGTNVLISVNVSGTAPGNGRSYAPVVSRDFTRVAFLSEATDLTTNVCNGKPQIFVRDLATGVTRLVSTDTNRIGSGDFTGVTPVIAPAGDLVAFDAVDNNLATDDRNDASDIFLYSWATDSLQLVTRAHPERLNQTGSSISLSSPASVSANGRYVAFSTLATNVYPIPSTNAFNFAVWDTWNNRNIVLDILTNPPVGGGSGFLSTAVGAKPPILSEDGTKLISVAQEYDSYGNPRTGYLYSLNLGTGSSTLVAQSRDQASSSTADMNPRANADGRYIVFQSDATTLSSPIADTNSQADVFLYDTFSRTTNLLSISTQGTVGNGPSLNPFITSDGKLAFFRSTTSNLDTNFPSYYTVVNTLLYVRDLAAGKTFALGDQRWSYNAMGNPVVDGSNRVVFFEASLPSQLGPAKPFGVFGFDLVTRSNIFFGTNSANPAISGNGRFLAYMKLSSFTVSDVYVRDLQTGKETLVTTGFDGNGSSNGRCTNVLISADGRYITFSSTASNLIPNDDNGTSDIFVRDRLLGVTTLLSVNRQGTGPASGASFQPVLSRDGRTVVFQSFADNLAEGDYNNFRDVFVARLGGIDSDGDGMDDDWEVAYFGNLSRNGAGDFDGDGQSDLQEFLAGTDPVNSGSILRVITVSGINSEVVTILWNAVAGKTYQVQYKDDLNTNSWTSLSGTVTATSSTGSKQDTQASGQRFYRVVVARE